jgi:hypothetical protein
MVSMLASIAVDRGFQSRLGQTKDYKNSYCCISANKEKEQRLGIRIMCPSGATYLPNDCC